MSLQDANDGQAPRSSIGIRAKTLGGLAILLGMLLAATTMLVADSWLAMRSAAEAEIRNTLAGDLAGAALELSLERGRTNSALMASPLAERPGRLSIPAQRAVADARIRQVLDWLDGHPEILAGEVRAELLTAIERVTELRRQVDVELEKPADRRDPAVAAAWLPAISGLIEVIRFAIGEQTAPAGAIDAELQAAIDARMAAFDLRNAAGEHSALLAGVLGSGRPLDLASTVQVGSRREAIDLHWGRLKRLAKSIDDARLEEAVRAVGHEYFGGYAELLEEITAAGLAREPYRIGREDYAQAVLPALARIDELILTSQQIAAEMLRSRVGHARLTLVGSLAAALVGIGVAGVSLSEMSRRVLRPIEQITGAMRRVASGWGPAVELPTAQRDEIGEMSRAIAAFRDAMVASEAALTEAERFSHQTIDALATHIAVLDESGKIIATNKSWRDFDKPCSGLRSGHESQNYLSVCDRAAAEGDADVAAIGEGIRSVIRGARGAFEVEYPCHHSAARRWFRMRVTRFAGKGPVRVVVAHDEITARRLAEESLREKNRLLELAERMALTGHWRHDLETGTLRWSREIYRIYGLDRSDRPPDPADAIAAYAPEDQALFQRTARRAIESGSAFSLDIRLIRSDGEVRNVEVLADCERGADGRVVALFGVCRDITERKRVAERLANLNVELEHRVAEQIAEIAAREAYLRGILDNVAEMVLTIDEHGRIESFNPAAERVLGYRAAEVIGRNVALLTDALGAGRQADPVSRGSGHGVSLLVGLQGHEAVAICKDGSRIPVELTVAEMQVAGRMRFIGAMRDITDRKRSERALLERATLLRRAQELAGIGHWSWRRERRNGLWHTGLDYSPAVGAIFGVMPQVLVVSDENYVARFVHPDDRAFVADAFRNYWRRRRDRRPLEYRIVRPDGTVRHIREVTENILTDAAEPSEVLGTVQDITERKEAEIKLRQSEASLRAIFDHAPVTISLRDVAGRYVMVNRRFREIFGRTEAEILGRTPTEFYPERFVADVRRGVEHVLRTRTVAVNEEGAPTVDGDRRYLTTRFPILGDDGELTGVGSISIDVTGERAAEAALRDSEARLRAIHESEPDCVALLSQDGRWLDINPAGLAMIEADEAEQVRGRKAVELVGTPYRDGFRAMIASVFAGESGSLLFEVRGLKTVRRWLAANAVPMRDSAGAVTALLMIARDVTGQRTIEEQLRHAQKMEAIGQLTGGLAHDFNNLLGVIVGNLDLLSLKLGPESTEKDLVDRAVAAAERGAALTQRLLAFARQQTLLPQNVDAGHLVAELAQLLRHTLGERIALGTDIDPDLMACYVDPAQLEAALLNLCLNARDAMPAGGLLTISARNEMPEPGALGSGRGFVVISVSDTGEGMAESVKARAFEPFFTTKGVGKGSGLGLSMVYGFVEQSGGHVKIESEVGRGTIVSLYLRATTTPAKGGDGEGGSRDIFGAGQLVLVVEDDDPVRAVAVEALSRLGYRVIEAADGQEALAALRDNEDIAALFTDVVLPGALDGFVLAAKVKALRPQVRVLYTSGFADKDRLPDELLDRDVELLPKPYRVSELGRRLGRLFAKEDA